MPHPQRSRQVGRWRHAVQEWLRAIVRLTSQGCESQPQANALRPETESNCDIVICGGEQQEVNRQSVR